MKITESTRAAMIAAGMDPDELRVPRGKARKPADPAGRGLGELVVEFVVEGRPVPWKAPTTTRSGHSFKDKRLVAWQAEVRRRASEAMAGRLPYPGPVTLEVHFELTRKAGSVPDLSNLTKAFEDSLQGSVIVNDRAVGHIEARRTLGASDRATARVKVAEEAS